jgi:hypothetical protein
MEYYSALEWSPVICEILEAIVLTEKSQAQKDKYHMISGVCGI